MKRAAAAFLILFGCLLLFSAAGKSGKAASYEKSGVRAEARIVRKELVPASRTGPAHSVFRVWFQVADSGPPTSAEFDPEEFENLREGGALRVIHIPGDAASVKLASEFRLDNGTGEGVSGIIFLIAGMVVFWFPSARREQPIPVPQAALIFRKAWTVVKTAAFWLMVVVLSALLAELPFVVAIQRHIDANYSPYFAGALSLMIGGLGLMIGSLLLRMKGCGSTSDEYFFLQLKEAFRSGAIHHPQWRWRLRIAIGAFTMGLGLASIFFVAGPPYLKVLVFATVLYVIVRTASAFWKA